MADQKRFHPLMPSDLQALYVDNGDGTYSLKVSTAAASAGPISTAAKGTTPSGSPTSTAVDANTQALDVYVRSPGAPATIADGADVAQGTTTDLSSASTVIGLLKNIKAALAGTLTVATHAVTGSGNFASTVADGANVALGTTTDASSASTVVGILKAIKASVGGTLAVSIASAILTKYDVIAAVAATASSATANGALVTLTVTDYATVIVSERADAGTQTTAEAVIFEVSDDGSSWFTIEGIRVDANALPESAHTTAVSETRLWQFNVAAFIGWRVRQTTAIVGTGTIVWRAQASAAPSQPRIQAETADGGNVVIGTAADTVGAATLHGRLRSLVAYGGTGDGAGVTTTQAMMVSGTDLTSRRNLRMNAKGTQGDFGLATQDLKDAGRSAITMTAVDQVLAVASTEILLTFTTSAANAANSGGVTTYAVTTGKRLRVQALVFTIRSSAASLPNARVKVRTTASGAVGLTSPLQFTAMLGAAPGTAALSAAAEESGSYEVVVPIPDGWELPAGHNIGFTWVSSNVTTALHMTLIGYEY